jgi:hypothetical protein
VLIPTRRKRERKEKGRKEREERKEENIQQKIKDTLAYAK